MSRANQVYSQLLNKILHGGQLLESRNSKVMGLRNAMIDFGSPAALVTVRKTAWKLALREMEWFLKGSCNINELDKSVRHWWEPWADERGFVANSYGVQFKHSIGHPEQFEDNEGFDQVSHTINLLKNDPFSRRNIMTTWNASEMAHPETPITNCHGTVIQFFGNPDGSTDMTMYQRSCDMLLGVPHNWIQYQALLKYLCHRSGRTPGKFTWIGGDCHIYEKHFSTAQKIAEIKEHKHQSVDLKYTPSGSDFLASDFHIDDVPQPEIVGKLEMVV